MKKLIAPIAALGLSMLIASPAMAYNVKDGDTMSEIASDNNVSLSKLSEANPQVHNIDLIYIGQHLNIPGCEEVVANTKTNEKAIYNKEVNKSKASTSHKPTAAKTATSSSSNYTTMNVEATAYTAYCAGCSGVTATGINLRSNPNQKVIAVDPRVIPLGSKVYVEGYGMAIAGDTGGAIKGNRIDLFIPNRQKMNDFGRRMVQIKVYK